MGRPPEFPWGLVPQSLVVEVPGDWLRQGGSTFTGRLIG